VASLWHGFDSFESTQSTFFTRLSLSYQNLSFRTLEPGMFRPMILLFPPGSFGFGNQKQKLGMREFIIVTQIQCAL
jgi:hypothetical protein